METIEKHGKTEANSKEWKKHGKKNANCKTLIFCKAILPDAWGHKGGRGTNLEV